MLRLGEETGQLPVLAGRVAEFYEAKLQRSLDRVVGIVGPLAIIVISIVVGGLIVSVMTALMSVTPDRRLNARRSRCRENLGQYFERRASGGKRRQGRQAGFTLVEMLVVITIIGLIMALIGPRVLNYLGESKVKAAKIQIRVSPARSISIISMLGRYPSTAEGLAALVRARRASRPGTGLICAAAWCPTIPGATAMSIASPGEHGRLRHHLLGSDGQEGGSGTAADISLEHHRRAPGMQ